MQQNIGNTSRGLLIQLLGKVHSEEELKEREEKGEKVSQFSGPIHKVNKVKLRHLKGRLMPAENEEENDEETNLSDIPSSEDDSETEGIHLEGLEEEENPQLKVKDLFPTEDEREIDQYYKQMLYGEAKRKIQPPSLMNSGGIPKNDTKTTSTR
jgi:hypothetical protein